MTSYHLTFIYLYPYSFTSSFWISYKLSC